MSIRYIGVAAAGLAVVGGVAQASENPGQSPLVPDGMMYFAQGLSTATSASMHEGYVIVARQPDGTEIRHHQELRHGIQIGYRGAHIIPVFGNFKGS